MQVSGNEAGKISHALSKDNLRRQCLLALYLGLPRINDPGEGAYPHEGKGVTHWLQQQRRLHSVQVHQLNLLTNKSSWLQNTIEDKILPPSPALRLGAIRFPSCPKGPPEAPPSRFYKKVYYTSNLKLKHASKNYWIRIQTTQRSKVGPHDTSGKSSWLLQSSCTK